MEIFLRDMTLEDVDRVHEIEKESFKTPWSRDSIQKEISENALSHYRVLVKDGLIIGYFGLWIVAGEGHVMNLALEKASRSQGFGNLLMEDLIKLARDNDVKKVTLEVRKGNASALGLYEKFGFEISAVRKNYYSDYGDDAYIMWLDLGVSLGE